MLIVVWVLLGVFGWGLVFVGFEGCVGGFLVSTFVIDTPWCYWSFVD